MVVEILENILDCLNSVIDQARPKVLLVVCSCCCVGSVYALLHVELASAIFSVGANVTRKVINRRLVGESDWEIFACRAVRACARSG